MAIMEESQLPSQRLFTDRWLCCVWEGNSRVGDVLDLQTYLQLGHVVYSTAAHLPNAAVDTYLARAALPRRVEFIVESFLLAPALLEGTDLVTLVLERAVPLLRRTAGIRRWSRDCGGVRTGRPTRPSGTSGPRSARSRPAWAQAAAEISRLLPLWAVTIARVNTIHWHHQLGKCLSRSDR
jgi:hypothetical protein